MNYSWSRPDVEQAGLGPVAISRMVRRGKLRRIRFGSYAAAGLDTPADLHRALIEGVWPRLEPSAVLSHASAALVHELPTWPRLLSRVSVTRATGGHGRRLTDVHYRFCRLPASQVASVGDLRVTSLLRTACDVARQVEFDEAVAVMDAALGRGVRRDELTEILQWQRCWPGAALALSALAVAVPGPQSVMESVSRMTMLRTGLPEPVVQLPVLSPSGSLIATCDFGWPDYGVVGEYDGEGKYGELLSPGRTGPEAIIAEKRRENAIRDAGWWVVRWTKGDLVDDARLSDLIRRALRRGLTNRQAG